MNKFRIIVFLTVCFCHSYSNTKAQNGQSYNVTDIKKFPLKAVVNVKSIKKDWKTSLLNIEMPIPGSESYRTYLQKIKDQIPPKKRLRSFSEYETQNIETPVILNSFDGNDFNVHVPNDNDLAVSNDNKIVSVINSIIYFYNPDSSISSPVSLEAFASDLGYNQGKYDPRILYDQNEDKFILVFLNGFNDSTSHIIVAFSETNDPAENWNLYSLPGNPFNDTSWSDFPMIALTNDELFLTINLLKNDEHWKTGFKQTLIWQIDKFSGFNGEDSLNSKYFSDIRYNNDKIRNLCPVQGGSELTGPNIFFLSNKNFSLSCDSIFIVEITGKINDPSTELNLSLSLADSLYGVPPLADQPKNRKLETNDARVLDAYIEKDEIHFVGNTVNFENNFASFYYGTINNLKLTNDVSLRILQHPYLEFGYPSIAYTGTLSNPTESIILFNHSSDSVFPGISSIYSSNNDFSEIIRIKEGLTQVTVQGQANQRWGDYTGLQRKYDEVGVVWGCGYYGKKRTWTSSIPFSRVNGTWIVKLQSPPSVAPPYVGSKVLTYPNPLHNQFFIEFYNENTQVFEFALFDNQGRLIKILLHDLVKEGKNIFSFNLDPLRPGLYHLVLTGEGKVHTKKKIIVIK